MVPGPVGPQQAPHSSASASGAPGFDIRVPPLKLQARGADAPQAGGAEAQQAAGLDCDVADVTGEVTGVGRVPDGMRAGVSTSTLQSTDDASRSSTHLVPCQSTQAGEHRADRKRGNNQNEMPLRALPQVTAGPWGGRRWIPPSSRHPRRAQVLASSQLSCLSLLAHHMPDAFQAFLCSSHLECFCLHVHLKNSWLTRMTLGGVGGCAECQPLRWFRVPRKSNQNIFIGGLVSATESEADQAMGRAGKTNDNVISSKNGSSADALLPRLITTPSIVQAHDSSNLRRGNSADSQVGVGEKKFHQVGAWMSSMFMASIDMHQSMCIAGLLPVFPFRDLRSVRLASCLAAHVRNRAEPTG